MKTFQDRSSIGRPAGLTLIEISLVIALLLGLAAFLFIGLGAFRRGADKARCKAQLASVQKVIRAQANFYSLAEGAVFATMSAFGPGRAMENAPLCPAGGTYTWLGIIPSLGSAYGACNFIHPDAVTTHVLSAVDTSLW
jgi:type II secretory pathway pseudopilin PulG